MDISVKSLTACLIISVLSVGCGESSSSSGSGADPREHEEVVKFLPGNDRTFIEQAETVIDGQSIKSGVKLINTPAGDLGPEQLARAVEDALQEAARNFWDVRRPNY